MIKESAVTTIRDRLGRLAVGLLAAALASGCAPDTPAPIDTAHEVPFRFERNQILLEVELNGHGPYTVLLDTAGDPSAVDLATAREASLPLDTTAVGEASGVGGERVPIYLSGITGLAIGGRAFGDTDALAIDLSAISERLGEPLHGLLGHGFLEGRIVQIDYPARRVRFYDSSDAARQASRDRGEEVLVLPLEFRPGDIAPWFDVHVGSEPVRVTLDTGSSLGLELYAPATARLGLETLRDSAETGSVLGARGSAEIATTTLDSVRLGTHTVLEAPVAFSDRADEGEREGNLGNRLLNHFVLTLDYVADTLRFSLPGEGP
jgi:hypothetical protein